MWQIGNKLCIFIFFITTLSFVVQTSYSQNSADKIRAEYILKIAMNTTWKTTIDTFRVGIIGGYDGVCSEINKYAKSLKISNKTIIAVSVKLLEQAENMQIIYGKRNDFSIQKFWNVFGNKSVMLISENVPLKNTMIDFIVAGDSLIFRINHKRIQHNGLKIKREVLDIVDKNGIDWQAFFYKNIERLEQANGENNKLTQELGELRKELKSKNDTIERFNLRNISLIELQALQEKNQLALVLKYSALNEKIKFKQIELLAKERLLFDAKTEMENHRAGIDSQKIKIERQGEVLENLDNEVHLQRMIVERQKKIVRDKMILIEKQSQWMMILWIFVFIILGAVIVIYRAYTSKKQINSKLKQNNIAIEKQKERIRTKNNLLKASNVELEKLSIVALETENSVLIFDANSRLEWFNAGYSLISGYTQREFKKATEKPTMKDLSQYEDINLVIKNAVKNHRTQTYQNQVVTCNNMIIWQQTMLTPIFDTNNKVRKFIVVDVDITKQKQAEEKLQRQKEQIEMARLDAENANRAKSEFLANMSHEIRTPMNAVIGFTDILSTLITDRKHKNYLDSIKTSGKSLLLLINDILDLSKIEAGKLELHYEPLDVRRILNEVTQLFAIKTAEKEIELVCNVDESTPQVFVFDEVRLRQILFNLIGNAIKFTENGFVKVFISANFEKNSDDESKLFDLYIIVEDSGIGISPHLVKLVFDSFKQKDGHATKKYGGTGLGLAITKRLVEIMNGKIFLESQVNVGSKFKIQFSDVIESADDELKTSAEIDLADIKFEECTLLVVDDVLHNSDLIKAFFRRTKVKVITAANGKLGIDAAIKHTPNAILMDIRMPIVNGYEANRIIKSDFRLKNIPVIAITAYAMKEEQKKIEQGNFDGFLMKPVKQNDLINILMKFLPYEKNITNTSISTENEDDTKSPEECEHCKKILSYIEKEIMPLRKKAMATNRMMDVEAFADSLHQIAKNNDVKMLLSYTKEVRFAVQSFDIEKISQLLNEFPKIIEQLKEINHVV